MKTRTVAIVILLAGGLGFLTIIAACAGFLFLTYRNLDAEVSPKIDAIFAAIDNGTFGETYSTETAPELRETATLEEYRQLGTMFKTNLGALVSKKLVHFNVQQHNADRYADVTYSATFERGAGTIRTRLKKVESEWLLVALHVDSPALLKLAPTSKCPHCGETHPASAKFCPNCGKAVTGPRATGSEERPKGPE